MAEGGLRFDPGIENPPRRAKRRPKANMEVIDDASISAPAETDSNVIASTGTTSHVEDDRLAQNDASEAPHNPHNSQNRNPPITEQISAVASSRVSRKLGVNFLRSEEIEGIVIAPETRFQDIRRAIALKLGGNDFEFQDTRTRRAIADESEEISSEIGSVVVSKASLVSLLADTTLKVSNNSIVRSDGTAVFNVRKSIKAGRRINF